ncbi:MAG: hypothetical protein WCJ29_01790 [bacterium]
MEMFPVVLAAFLGLFGGYFLSIASIILLAVAMGAGWVKFMYFADKGGNDTRLAWAMALAISVLVFLVVSLVTALVVRLLGLGGMSMSEVWGGIVGFFLR